MFVLSGWKVCGSVETFVGPEHVGQVVFGGCTMIHLGVRVLLAGGDRRIVDIQEGP